MNTRARKQTDSSASPSLNPTISNLSKALFVVNRHAKTAPDPKYLYFLKKKALEKLLQEGKAKKCGLHYSRNPKLSQQRSDLLVSVGDYYFHMPPSKEDFQALPHLGQLNQKYRNPKTHMALTQAKTLLQKYTGIKEKSKQSNHQHKKYQRPVFKRLGETY